MKFYKILSVCALSAFLLPMVSSCGGDDVADDVDPEQGGGEIENPDVKPADEVWEASKAKSYLQEVGLEVQGKISANDFRHYTSLAEYINEAYIDNDDFSWDAIGDWGEDIFDDLKGDLLGTTTETESGYSWIDYYHYDLYKSIIMASNFKGHWTAGSRKWTFSEADDIKFYFTNRQGQQCILSLTTSGTAAKVHCCDVDDWNDSDYKYSDGQYIYNDYYDRTQLTIAVPEKIELTLTENGTTLVEQTINIDLSGISNEEFDLSSSKLSFNSDTKLSNGYEVKVTNVAYSSTSATAQCSLIKDKETLIVVKASTNLSGIPSQTLTDYDIDEDELEDRFDNANATNVAFSVDVLGKIQVKGSCTDVRKLCDYLDDADDNDENESAFKQAVSKANGCYTAYLYYNGGNAKQAYMTLTPFKESDWGYTWWDYDTTINLGDGSSYSFDDYFTEDYFKELIDAIEDLGDSFEDLVD